MVLKKHLEQSYALNTPMTRTDLEDLFSKLTKHYEDQISRQKNDLKLSLTIKDIKKLYQHLAMVNDSNGSQHFEVKRDYAVVQISDLIVLFDMLA